MTHRNDSFQSTRSVCHFFRNTLLELGILPRQKKEKAKEHVKFYHALAEYHESKTGTAKSTKELLFWRIKYAKERKSGR